MSETLQFILKTITIEIVQMAILVNRIAKVRRTQILTDTILQDWRILELNIEEVTTFKKWGMLWKCSDEPVTARITDIFTKEFWEDYMILIVITPTPQESMIVLNTPPPLPKILQQ